MTIYLLVISKLIKEPITNVGLGGWHDIIASYIGAGQGYLAGARQAATAWSISVTQNGKSNFLF